MPQHSTAVGAPIIKMKVFSSNVKFHTSLQIPTQAPPNDDDLGYHAALVPKLVAEENFGSLEIWIANNEEVVGFPRAALLPLTAENHGGILDNLLNQDDPRVIIAPDVSGFVFDCFFTLLLTGR